MVEGNQFTVEVGFVFVLVVPWLRPCSLLFSSLISTVIFVVFGIRVVFLILFEDPNMIQVVDPVKDYVELMKTIVDFGQIKTFLAGPEISG